MHNQKSISFRLRQICLLAASILFALGLLIWLLLPVVTKTVLNHYFQQHNAQLIIQDLDINPFKGVIKVNNVSAYSFDSETPTTKKKELSLESAEFSLSYGFLFTKTIYISSLQLKGLDTELTQSENAWHIAGLTFPTPATNDSIKKHSEDTKNKSEPPSSEESKNQWKIDIPKILIADIHLAVERLNTEKPAAYLRDTLDIDYLTLSNIKGLNDIWQGEVDLDIAINQSRIKLHSQINMTPEKVIASVDLNQLSVDAKRFHHYFPKNAPSTQLSLLASGNLSIRKELSDNNQEVTLLSDYFSIQLADINIKSPDETLKSDKIQLNVNDLMINLPSNSLENKIHFTTHSTLNLLIQNALFTNNINQNSSVKPSPTKTLDLSIDQLTAESKINIIQNDELLSLSSEQSSLDFSDLMGNLFGTALNNSASMLTFTDIQLKKTSNDSITFNGNTAFESNKFRASSVIFPYSISYEGLQFGSQIQAVKDAKALNLLTKNSSILVEQSTFVQPTLDYTNDFTELNLETLNVDLLLNDQNDLSIAADTQFHSQNTHLTYADNLAQYDDLTFSGDIAFDKQEGNLHAQSQDISFTVSHLKGSQSDYILNSELSNILIPHTDLTFTSDEQLLLSTNPSFFQQQLNVSDKSYNQLIDFEELSITPIEIKKTPDTFSIDLDQLTTKNITLSKPHPDSTTNLPLVELSKILVNSLSLTETHAKIGEVTFTDLVSNILLDADRSLKNLVLVQSDDNSNMSHENITEDASNLDSNPQANELEKASLNVPPEDSEPFHLILNQFDILGNSSIHVVDEGVSPGLDQTLIIDKFRVSQVDTSNAQQQTHITFEGRNGKYSSINLESDIIPLSDSLTMNTSLSTKEIELTPFSPYVADLLGYTIESGQLDADVSLKADKGKLDGNSNLLLRRFDLAGGNSESSKSPSAIPLNLAIGALKDSQDNIALKIPMSGDIENPKFQWENFLIVPIRKALYAASSSYLMQTLVPYANVISVVQIAGEQFLKLRVEPLHYEPAQVELSSSQVIFIEELAALLTEKSDTQLKMCSIATHQDLGLQDQTTQLNEEQTQSLKSLAQQRAETLKEQLVVEMGIASARLLLCAPSVDQDSNASARVEFEF